MKILFDRYGAQVQATLGPSPDRLDPLFDAITRAGWTSEIASGELLPPDLAPYDVLVLTTRMKQGFSDAELAAISGFVQSGRGLWSMANHAGFSIASQTEKDFLKYNSAVASMFFTSLEAAAYSIPGPAIPVPLSGSNLTDHPIISGNPGWPIYSPGGNSRISTVVTRSFCGVYQNYFSDAIATLADLDNVINTQTDQAVTEGVVWALALEKSQVTGPGRVVICGDSGWLGSENSKSPGPGEFEKPDNPQFALNTLAWLGGLA
jgi:hypothetical protein